MAERQTTPFNGGSIAMRRALLPSILVALALLGWWAVRSGVADPAGPAAGDTVERGAPEAASATVGGGSEGAPANGEERTPVGAAAGAGALDVLVVAEPDDVPLAHVAVHVVARDGRAEESTRRVAVTDDLGRARFDVLDAGPWAVATDRSVNGQDETAVDVRAGAVNEVTIRVPAGIDAIVRVVDAAGGRVPGADVLHWPANGLLDIPAWEPAEVIGQTDALGELEVRALPNLRGHGSWFAARHAQLGTSIARMVRSPDDDADRAPRLLELRLDVQGSWIDLRVGDENGTPIADAVATARPVDQPSSEDDEQSRVLRQTVRRERTARDGRARIGPLVAGRYLLRVRAAGRAPYREPVQVDGEEVLQRDVVLLPEARVLGVVTGAGGEPVAGARIQIQLEPEGGAAQTGPDGAFSIGELGAGAAAWVVRHGEYEQRTGKLELVAGEEVELAITLEPLPLLHGRVVDESGVGLGGWRVVATLDLPGYADDVRRGQTDTDGTFRLAVRADVDYALAVIEPGQTFAASIPELGPVRARDEPWIVTVPDAARATAFIEGFLFDRAGDPAIGDKWLSVLQQDRGARRAWYGNTAPNPETDPASGRFRVGPLPPGTYALWIRSADQWEFSIPDIVLRPHTTTSLGRIVEPATGTLEVRLDTEPGLLLGDVLTQVDSANNTEILRIAEESLSGDRRFVPGSYEVTVYGDGFRWLRWRKVEVRPGETTTLRGTLRAAVKTGLRFHMPAGEDGATFEVRDARGELADEVELEAGVASEDWWPHLDRGRFTVTATGTSGRKYATEFTIETLERRETLINIRVEPVR